MTPEGEIPFQAVRDHMQAEYVLSATDWEKVKRILSWFSNPSFFNLSNSDQTISRAEFFAVYDENGDRCSDRENSSDFLGEDLPILEDVFDADFECNDIHEHSNHQDDFQRGAREYATKMAEIEHDFALWQAIGTFLQGQFKIPESQQLRIIPSCSAPDEKKEKYYLHLRKDLKNALQDWIDRRPEGKKDAPAPDNNSADYCSEITVGLLRDNPEMAADDLFEVIDFFKANPDFVTHSSKNVMAYIFPDRHPESQNDSFTKRAYFQAAYEDIYEKLLAVDRRSAPAKFFGLELCSSFVFYPAWYWQSGLGDLFREIAANTQHGPYTVMTDRGPFTFYKDKVTAVPWSHQQP